MDIKAINRSVIRQFRAGGPVDDMDRTQMILLTSIGARTGRRHTTPLGIIERDSDRLLVVANNLGGQHHPDWYFNVLANGHVTVEADGETYEAVARQLPVKSGIESGRTWKREARITPSRKPT